LAHTILCAKPLALLRAGNNTAISKAIIDITTRSSTSVNPFNFLIIPPFKKPYDAMFNKTS
jgi:hypothetical protein